MFSAFNTQTVRHVLKTLAIFSFYLPQMHYVLHESIRSTILQHFTSITRQHFSSIVNNWPVYWREGYLKTRKVHIFLGHKYCILLSYFNVYSIRSSVSDITPKLRAGRFADLVPVRAIFFSFSKTSWPLLGPTAQGEPGALPDVRRVVVWI
jgi:hypothetical protein